MTVVWPPERMKHLLRARGRGSPRPGSRCRAGYSASGRNAQLDAQVGAVLHCYPAAVDVNGAVQREPDVTVSACASAPAEAAVSSAVAVARGGSSTARMVISSIPGGGNSSRNRIGTSLWMVAPRLVKSCEAEILQRSTLYRRFAGRRSM